MSGAWEGAVPHWAGRARSLLGSAEWNNGLPSPSRETRGHSHTGHSKCSRAAHTRTGSRVRKGLPRPPRRKPTPPCTEAESRRRSRLPAPRLHSPGARSIFKALTFICKGEYNASGDESSAEAMRARGKQTPRRAAPPRLPLAHRRAGCVQGICDVVAL